MPTFKLPHYLGKPQTLRNRCYITVFYMKFRTFNDNSGEHFLILGIPMWTSPLIVLIITLCFGLNSTNYSCLRGSNSKRFKEGHTILLDLESLSLKQNSIHK